MGIRRDECAEAGVIAEVLLIAASIAGAAALFLMFSGTGGTPPPSALGINDDGAAIAGTKRFTVAQVLPDIEWGGLSFLLDGTRLSYSTTLAADNTYCVAVGPSCSPNDPARDVVAGQQVRIHHTILSGKTILIVENASNALLYQKILGP